MTLLTHILWGSLWCTIFGFSFTVLRIAVLVQAWLAAYTLYRILFDHLQWSSSSASLGAAVLLFHPMYYLLSFSFMTDVPFLLYLLAATYFFMSALGALSRNRKYRALLWATVFSVLAVLIRQFGLLAPLSFAVIYFLRQPGLGRLVIAGLPLIITFGVYQGYLSILQAYDLLPQHFSQVGQVAELLLRPKYLDQLPLRMGVFFFCAGLFLWPLIKFRRKLHWTYFVMFFAIAGGMFAAWELLPSGNLFYNLGLGPKLLRDAYYQKVIYPTLGASSLFLLRGLGLVGALGLFSAVLDSAFAKYKVRFLQGYALVLIVLYLGFLLINSYYFDRYQLLFVPFLIILLPFQSVEHNSKIAFWRWLAFGSLALFSILGTHDYLDWNRARWRALQQLESAGISPRQIDGGFEYNAWKQTGKRNPQYPQLKSWWFVDQDTYTIAFHPTDCGTPIDSTSYRSYLSGQQKHIYTIYHQQDTTHQLQSDLEIIDSSQKYFLSSNPKINLANGSQQSNIQARSGAFAVRLNPENAFALSHSYHPVTACAHIRLSIWRKAKTQTAGVVCSAPDPDQFYLFLQQPTASSRGQDWEHLSYDLRLPPEYPSDTLQIYLWNPGQEEVYFDDFNLSIEQ